MDPRPLNVSLQEMLCRSENGTGNGPGTGNGTNGSFCDLLRRGLRGPPAPRGENGGGKERDGPGKGPPVRARLCAPRHAGTPLSPAVPARCAPPCAPVLPVPGRCRPSPPCPSSHPSSPIPAPRAGALWPRHCPVVAMRISALPGGTRRAVPVAAAGREGTPVGTPRTQTPLAQRSCPTAGAEISNWTLEWDGPVPPHQQSQDLSPHPTPGWGPYSGLSLWAARPGSPVPAPPREPWLSTEAGQDGGTHLVEGPSASRN